MNLNDFLQTLSGYSQDLDTEHIVNTPDSSFVFLVLVTTLIFIGFYVVLPYAWGFVILAKKQQEKKGKQKTLNELMIMKELQGELDKDIEETFIKEAEASKNG